MGKMDTGNTLWNGIIQVGSGGVAGGFSSILAGGNFNDGFRQGVITAGLNHTVHMFEKPQTLNEFVEERFGKDFRSKYGVKSLQWASSMPKEGISADGETFTYNSKTGYINSSSGSDKIGGITKTGGHIYIANALLLRSTTLYLEATVGHELIHSYHLMKFGVSFRSSYSEHAAYSYSVDFYKKNNLDAGEMRGLKFRRDSYMWDEKYNYKKVPGF